jgi:ParB-like chromosome segregation protein Spo0J
VSDLSPHPIADYFPQMDDAAFAELVDDISEHGLLEPIVLYEGKILDGRHRYRACIEAGIEPEFTDYEGDDPLAFAISVNLRRRHLSESQRAMIAERLAPLENGQRSDLVQAPSIEGAAQMLNVGRASVERARFVRRNAIPDLVNAVERDEISVSAAAKLAKERADVQAERMKLPTPKEAKKQAVATGKCVVGRDGMIHTPVPEKELRAAEERNKLWWKFRNAVEALSELPDPAGVLATVPSYQHDNVDRFLALSTPWLCAFTELWHGKK